MRAEFTSLCKASEEYVAAAEFRKIPTETLKKQAEPMWLLKIVPTEITCLNSEFKKDGYGSRQIWRADAAVYLRYLASTMLIMTAFVTVCILVPMGAGFRKMLLSGNGLYHHTLNPILSVVSYIFWEPHTSSAYAWLLLRYY